MEEQEISLRDYIDLINKRKKIVLGVFFISIIIAAVISLLTPKVYMAKAVIQNGNLDGPIIKKAEAEEIIKSHIFLSSAIKNAGIGVDNMSGLRKAIEVESIANTDFLRIIVKYKGTDAPVRICQGIVDSYLTYARPMYQERLKLLDSELKDLADELKGVKDDIQNLQKIMSSFLLSQGSNEAMSEPSLIFLRETLSNHRKMLSYLNSKRNELNLLRLSGGEFKIIDAPFRERKPVKPKTAQNIIMSAVMGLMLGLFLAFFFEFWEKSKR